MRRYYVHKRHNGIIYAELIEQKTGRKLPARSTRTRNQEEALIVIGDWLANGIKTGKDSKSRPVEAICDVKGIIKAVRKTDLTPKDAIEIVKVLKDLSLIDVIAVPQGKGSIDFISYLLDFWNYETSEYIKEHICQGRGITKRHCHECTNYVKRHWEPVFREKTKHHHRERPPGVFTKVFGKRAGGGNGQPYPECRKASDKRGIPKRTHFF